MTQRRLRQLVSLLPFAVTALAYALNSYAPELYDERGNLAAVVMAFFALHPIGIYFYVPFFLGAALYSSRLDDSAHETLTRRSPLIFATWVVFALLIYTFAKGYEPFTPSDFAACLMMGAYGAAIGYVYLATLFVLRCIAAKSSK